ncbi:hypothetical protein GGI07_005884 [Coemansia sp. Benny D115]|nr:hypothetical protein GGI07_005884 [Coemansia sp. Benny D115]
MARPTSPGEVVVHEPAMAEPTKPTSTLTSSSFPMRNSPQLLTATGNGSNPKRLKKVALKPGFSPLDWARLINSGENLSGVQEPRLYTLEEVGRHNKRDDCWMVIGGKIYNVTRYMDFHPGGKGQLMRAAGKDGTQLFYETHGWVNPDNILSKCFVGILADSNAR